MTDFTDLAKGLLTLEINTVQKDGMSGQKMPTIPNALIDLAQVYWDFLCRKAIHFGPAGQPLEGWALVLSHSFDWGREPFPQRDPQADRPVAHPEGEPPPAGHRADFGREAPSRVTLDFLDDLREVATWLAEMQLRASAVASGQAGSLRRLKGKISEEEMRGLRAAVREFRPEERAVLHRIKRNCDQFKVIAKRLPDQTITRDCPDDRFQPTEIIQIRKAWDIGVEIILMQTVIQLDGDVLNRFQAGMDGPEKSQLHALHASAVDLSFRYWRGLIDAVVAVTGKAFAQLLSP